MCVSVPIEFQPIWEMKNWIFLQSCKYLNYIQKILKITKGVIRSLKSKKDLFFTGQILRKKDLFYNGQILRKKDLFYNGQILRKKDLFYNG